jgi:hypothetical protein
MLLVAAAVLRCSAFSSSPDTPEPSDDASSRDVTPPDDAAADTTYQRTGMACLSENEFCSVGDSCCYPRSGPPICAPSCGTAFDAGDLGYTYECGRTSDCAEGLVCCFEGNHVCGAANSVTSHCLPKENCSFCYEEDGGTGQRGCDPARTGECPAPLRCTLRTTGAPWHLCAPP